MVQKYGKEINQAYEKAIAGCVEKLKVVKFNLKAKEADKFELGSSTSSESSDDIFTTWNKKLDTCLESINKAMLEMRKELAGMHKSINIWKDDFKE